MHTYVSRKKIIKKNQKRDTHTIVDPINKYIKWLKKQNPKKKKQALQRSGKGQNYQNK